MNVDLVIKIGDKSVYLTMQEAKELAATLHEIFYKPTVTLAREPENSFHFVGSKSGKHEY